jgi:peptide/nickel transport system permease protein
MTSASIPSVVLAGSPTTTARSLRVPLLFIALLILVAVAAPVLAPYSPQAQLETITMKSLAPSAAHPFGTDANSRDVLSRVIYGSRVSLLVASLSALVALTIGVCFGALAALGGPLLESVMMRLLDILLALPRLLILLAVTALWDGLTVLPLAVLLGATGWHDIARLIHGETRSLVARDFIVAAAAAGVGRVRMFLRHMFPHLVPLLAVSASLGVASSISLEAGLSYLGLGVQGHVSWGTIMHDGLGVVDTQWWLTIFPGLAAVVAVIACNALGEALRDRFARRQLDA